jgi:hypothetical protein
MLRRSTVLPTFSLALFFLALGGPAAHAQNVLMNSAETINKGNFKLSAFPTVLLGEDDADSEWGIASRFGYGFTDRFDMEGKVAFFDGIKLYGLDAELWLLRDEIDLSVSLGAHKKSLDGPVDSSAIDVAGILSKHLSPNFELYGGVNVSFESLDDIPDSDFTRVYIVPGIEYKLSEQLDLLAEVGIGTNDDSPNYVSFGLAIYFR